MLERGSVRAESGARVKTWRTWSRARMPMVFITATGGGLQACERIARRCGAGGVAVFALPAWREAVAAETDFRVCAWGDGVYGADVLDVLRHGNVRAFALGYTPRRAPVRPTGKEGGLVLISGGTRYRR